MINFKKKKDITENETVSTEVVDNSASEEKENTEETVKKSQKETKSKKEPKEKKPFDRAPIIELLKNTGIILAITLIAGGILGVVYQVTKEPIAIMEQKTLDNANRKAFNSASVFETTDYSGALTDESGKEIGKITKTLLAKDSEGNTLGYVLNITTNQGYGGDISFSMGIENNGTIVAISITSISETAGLGMRAEEVLIPQFAGKRAELFVVTKTGSTNDSEIDAISSATITSKAITNAVNAGLEFFRVQLGGGADNE